MNYLGAAEAVVRETFQLGVELARIGGGGCHGGDAAADRRFADPAWSEHPMYRQLAQVYLAWAAGVGRSMGSVFTWMRPDDLVFKYWVNNYLMGEKPPTFDILAWNADGTNLPAALHAQFLDIFASNSLCQPGAMTVLGSPIDLSRISLPKFVTGAVTDHLTPWKGCYQTTQLIDGPSTFVLSNAGHIASLVNPPGNPKASYYTGGAPGPDPEAWLASATQHTGSWWETWADWITKQSGTLKPAPARLGSRKHTPDAPAPGVYVHDLAPSDFCRESVLCLAANSSRPFAPK